MALTAIVDITGVDALQGPATQVAGLSLVERTARLAAVSGAKQILIQRRAGDPTPIQLGLGEMVRGVPLFDLGPSSTTDHQRFSPTRELLYLRADAVYHRSSIQSLPSSIRDRLATGDALRSEDHRIQLLRASRPLTSPSECADAFKKYHPYPEPGLSPQWLIPIASVSDIDRAEQLLWQACRKPEDGIVAQLLNRHISIAISKRLAPTSIGPNHITALTFVLGVVAALFAALGHYWGFLLAGLVYQTNSVIDGVDGELARVRYEFSFLGEWLDTISDDLADLFFYLGLGLGAWQTAPPPPFLPDPTWLVLGLAAAGGKALSMVVYYRWLIANKRGDLLAFQWSFEDDSADPDSIIDRLLASTRYLFRKDFIVFAAMLCAIAGVLPYLLIALAPGNLIVAISVVIQQLTSPPTTPSS